MLWIPAALDHNKPHEVADLIPVNDPLKTYDLGAMKCEE
jgi:hypothetical protein